jgi:putative salt-induced outer membrane protein YdiY
MKHILMASLLAVGLLAANQAQAQAENAFKTTLSAGMTLTDGNSETMQANGSLVTEGQKEGLGSVRAGVEANYGQNTVSNQDNTTVNNARGFANVKKTITPRTFGYLDGSIVHDEIADIRYRVTVGPGLGVYLVKNDNTKLSVEAGPSYVWEEVEGVRDDYFAVRFAERFDQVLSATAKLWQSAEYLPKADDFGDYLLSAELGVEAAMTTRLNLRLVLQDRYDSTPGTGLKENDLTLIAGIGVKL